MQQSLTSLIVLACLIPLIIVTIYLFKKSMIVRLTGNQSIQLINQMSIGTKERLLLLKVNDDMILVGVTAHNISTLHVINGVSTTTNPEHSQSHPESNPG
jgi:flagellar protein FliO/FliZ